MLFGHSMGSFLGRRFVADHSDALAGAIFSGSSGKPPPIAALGRLIARVERLRLGPRGKSALLNQMMFGDFNKSFKPARTAFDWLSRDPAEVDRYVADPLCGFPFSTQLTIDLLDALAALADPASLAPIRKDLPIYVFSGEKDPVGANIESLIDAMKSAGFSRLTTRIYPGARHETLNETNRDGGDARSHRLVRRSEPAPLTALRQVGPDPLSPGRQTPGRDARISARPSRASKSHSAVKRR